MSSHPAVLILISSFNRVIIDRILSFEFVLCWYSNVFSLKILQMKEKSSIRERNTWWNEFHWFNDEIFLATAVTSTAPPFDFALTGNRPLTLTEKVYPDEWNKKSSQTNHLSKETVINQQKSGSFSRLINGCHQVQTG